MRRISAPPASWKSPRHQRGAVLYVALVMLILLALIGIVGMQVTGLQEKMSANYRNMNLAFQRSETRARTVETAIKTQIDSGESYEANQEVCSPTFDPLTWAELPAQQGVANAAFTRRIDKCFPASSLKLGTKQNEETGNIYEVTVLASDRDTNASSNAVINTIFIP